MLKNYSQSRIFIKTLKLLKVIRFEIKSYIIRQLSKFIPRSLLGRIIIYFMIIVFAIVAVIFIFIYDHHWRKIRDKLISGVANDVYYTSIIINNKYAPSTIPSIVYQSFYKFNIINNPNSNALTKYNDTNNDLSKNATILKDTLKEILPYTFYILEDNNNISILVLLSDQQWCEFYISEDVFFISSLQSIVVYTLIIYFILILVSYIFFKILINPLRSLSKSVDLFGKGRKVKYLQPRGALEIRNTIKAFNEMKERINRYIEQRTLMLSGISHDLKSTLTKMSLILELDDKNPNNIELLEEVDNMNQMLGNYLTFANNEYNEEPRQLIAIKKFFNTLVNQLVPSNKYKVNINFKIFYNTINIRPITLKRAIINILNNAIRFASIIDITIKDSHRNHLKIIIDDNGPGINPKDYENVFKPFFKLNAARTVEKGSVGLGLSIVKDAINKHGGTITLEKSPYNGLRVTILIPY
ncbi:ATP-binding protein [Rickettsiales bacterium LUAb2]